MNEEEFIIKFYSCDNEEQFLKDICHNLNCLQKVQNNWNKLNMWTESCINELKENDVYDRTSYEQGQIIALEIFIDKIQELENSKDDKNI